jgi:hypothetical protein
MTLLHMIPHSGGLSRDPLYTSFPYPARMNTIVHFIGSGETCCMTASRVWHSMNTVPNVVVSIFRISCIFYSVQEEFAHVL